MHGSVFIMLWQLLSRHFYDWFRRNVIFPEIINGDRGSRAKFCDPIGIDLLFGDTQVP